MKLSESFEETIVLTADPIIGGSIQNLNVISTNWKQGKRVRSVFRFIFTSIPVLLRNRDAVVFSHMTEVQSFLIAPLCRLLGMRHFLWYAHSYKSLYLKLSIPFLSGVLSSTQGSCPVNGRKVRLIGQGVELPSTGVNQYLSSPKPFSWYHISRIDTSKRIELLIEVVHATRLKGYNLTLDIFGAPSSKKMEKYFIGLKKQFRDFTDLGWLRFLGQLERNKLSSATNKYDGFIHAFQGSLDKTLVEATLGRKLVVTTNSEYRKEFLLKENLSKNEFDYLCFQLELFINSPLEVREAEIQRRFEIALSQHSLDGWIQRLSKVLLSDREVK